ncbi:MAG: hypothetical protein K0R38_6816 [Polyangiaceae bacterium]|jgi:hypothetical protein|nr:hypothetical protein [Polyangiaceae bacterium]
MAEDWVKSLALSRSARGWQAPHPPAAPLRGALRNRAAPEGAVRELFQAVPYELLDGDVSREDLSRPRVGAAHLSFAEAEIAESLEGTRLHERQCR